MPRLEPITSYDPEALGERLHELVNRPGAERYFKSRYAPGVVKRHQTSIPASVNNVTRAMAAHENEELAAYAVVSDYGLVQGMATLYPGLPLLEQKLPLPPKLARRLGMAALMEGRKYQANANAWVITAQSPHERNSLLKDAYEQLLISPAAEQLDVDPLGIWTIEPLSAPPYVHDAIVAAGMQAESEGRYDVHETSYAVPPRSRLYHQAP